MWSTTFSSQNFVAIVESFSILSVIIDKTKIIQITGPFLAITAIKSNPKKTSLISCVVECCLSLGEVTYIWVKQLQANHFLGEATTIPSTSQSLPLSLYILETQISCVNLALMLNILIKIDAIVNRLVLSFGISYRGISQILVAAIIME